LPQGGNLSLSVAITIDDGPDPDITPPVLALLEGYGVCATFFCIGERVLRYPELAQEIMRRGHVIENHSQRHRHNFSLLGPSAMASEVSQAQESIFRVTGSSPKFFRAPRAAPCQLDAPRLRHGERRCRCGVPPLGQSDSPRRYLAAA
jgi:peptidoglycan/xylan/chitin deacetylase (PgdA/CDA1 family)